jgi:replication factor C subunit 3/5
MIRKATGKTTIMNDVLSKKSVDKLKRPLVKSSNSVKSKKDIQTDMASKTIESPEPTNDRCHLPFVERFRPKTLDGIISHQETIEILKGFIEKHNIPHLLFYGPPGTGKTSTIEAFITELYGEDDFEFMTMNINASEERGIDIVRGKIKNFVSTMPIKSGKPNAPKYKFVILDEADAMTSDAQGMLKQVIEFYTYNVRFCLICNCTKKINPAIQSRCTVFNFPPLDFDSVKIKINMIADEFGLTITDDGIETLWKLSNGDMRKVLHMLQVISINNKIIDSDKVTSFQKYPTITDVSEMFKTLIRGNFKESLMFVKTMMKIKHYSLTDILTELTHKIIENLVSKKMDPDKGCHLLTNMRDIEMNIIVTTDTDIQLSNIVASFTDTPKKNIKK